VNIGLSSIEGKQPRGLAKKGECIPQKVTEGRLERVADCRKVSRDDMHKGWEDQAEGKCATSYRHTRQ
jgi:hypothetical protein